MIDSIRNNYVTDFFYFELIDFPVFNVADVLSYWQCACSAIWHFSLKEEDYQFP